MLDIKTLGKNIKELRSQYGLTQTMFADAMHVSFQAVSNWERGIAPPDLDNLVNIAAYFNVLIDDLLRQQVGSLILGIDGGGTKTEFAVVTMDGHILKHFKRDGSNPNDIGFENAVELLQGGINDALLEYPSIRGVFCGLAGLASGNQLNRMTKQLQSKYPSLVVDVQNDSANLFAMDDESDIAVISGTGSVVFVKKETEYVRLGGWGYLFGDAGSAYGIGRDAIAQALWEEDTLEVPGMISQTLRNRLNVPDMWSAIGKVYEEGKPFIASLAQIVFDAYRQNDSQAYRIIDDNAKQLGELLNCGVKIHHATPRAIASGGIFEHYGDIILSHLKKYTDAEIVLCNLPPIYGACRQAHKLLQSCPPDCFYDNFKKTYGVESE